MDSPPNAPEARSLRGSSCSPESQDSKSKKKSSKPGSKKTSLQEAKKKGRMDQRRGEEEMASLLKNLDLHSKPRATGTGLIYSSAFALPRCLWDSDHPECPERVTAIMEKLGIQGLLSRCVQMEARPATDEELLLVHTKQHVELMKSTQKMSESELMSLSKSYDSVYLHPESFPSASMAVGAVLQLVDKVVKAELRNGFAVIRPPGHHAQADKMNGYCMFNSLAIAARYAQTQLGLERVLIVDWDVHHGQGIQYIFQEDPSVLYFSAHRYEGGTFWPHLPESDSGALGSGAGEGYNINLPWNKTGLKDADYIAAVQQLLLPVAYEFRPQLVLVAAGFDCVAGDPKGEMSASPQCFAVLTHLLQGLAQGRLILALEGGYNPQAAADGVCACVSSLLGEPCPRLMPPGAPSDSALKSISQTISSLYPFWTCLQILEGGPLCEEMSPINLGSVEPPSESRGESPAQVTGLVYDQRMMEHHNMWDSHHPELPQRVSRIFSRHEELGLVSRCLRIPARLATEEELAMCHSLEHIAKIKSTEGMKPRDLHRLGDEYNSIYICNESYRCALLAAGACFNAAEAVLTGQVRNAVAIVRPPGHHAERDAACGFCFFNTAALTARYAQAFAKRPLRVLILDWDVHHGNGTQHIFEDDDSVLYISLHRYDNGLFFPSSDDADCDKVGRGRGRGFNVNIPWSGGRMGDSEYLAAFHAVVMPIGRQFDPDLVLLSAGFDAARGDPLGGYHVTPEGYAHLTHLLMSLAAGRVILVLEGGYNLTSISESMSMCTSTLLGDSPPPLPPLAPPHPNAAITINRVLRSHAPYWSALRIRIPESLRLSLPSPKAKGKRVSGGRDKRSPRQGTPAKGPEQGAPPTSPAAGEAMETVQPSTAQQEPVQPSTAQQEPVQPSTAQQEPVQPSTAQQEPVQPSTAQQEPEQPSTAQQEPVPSGGIDGGLQDITLGLVSLNLDNSSSSPASVPVGGARRKVKPGSQEDPVKGERSPFAQVTPEKKEGIETAYSPPLQDKTVMPRVDEPALVTVATGNQEPGELDEASGWSKSAKDRAVFELFTGGLETDEGTMYVVEPLPWCPHLETVRPVPSGGIDVFLPCEDCGSDAENWVCLICYKVFCGRYVSQHMVTHGLVSGHPLVLSFADLSVWCYSCEAYVHNKVLHEAKNAAHQVKFGEDIPYTGESH